MRPASAKLTNICIEAMDVRESAIASAIEWHASHRKCGMKVLTSEDLGIAAWGGIEPPMLEWEPSAPSPRTGSTILTEQQEAFLRDRFGIRLENPQTGRWIRSWRTDGE